MTNIQLPVLFLGPRDEALEFAATSGFERNEVVAIHHPDDLRGYVDTALFYQPSNVLNLEDADWEAINDYCGEHNIRRVAV